MNHRLSAALLFFLLFYAAFKTSAQIYINEFCASNSAGLKDPDYNNDADWIEIYNNGNTAVNLAGFYLTDNLSKPTKWKIPTGVQIAAHGYVLFWADTMNTGRHTNFALSASGEQIGLSDKSGKLIDSVLYGIQNTDLYNYGAGSITVLDSTLLGIPDPNMSMGRKPDGSSDWVFFTIPTPGASNSTMGYTDIVKSDPSFSLSGGIYHSSISLELKTIFGGDAVYTIDGTEPNEQSLVASEPINISTNTVVRARIYKKGQVLGPVNTNTYLIDTDNKINNLPVVCVSSDPVNLWDPVKGIYVPHSTKPKWEIPVNIELYENDGRTGAAFNLKAGVKSTGLYSWQLPEKMLGVSFRKEYGPSKLEYPIIFDKPRNIYKTFTLRASGSDWGNTMFRDGMLQTASVENTSNDESGFRACVVYINGEYMGIHNIREKIDEDYIVENHGYDPGTFDMIEETDSGHYAETGNLIANTRFLGLVSKDLSIQTNYDAVDAEMDIQQFTEMVCTEVYSGNNSVGHNLMKYKPRGSGKWRWILMDFDRCFYGANNQLISFYVNENDWPFKDLMKNPNYKKQFGLKLSDLLFTTFNPDRMIERIERHKKTIEAEMPYHIERWAGTHGTGNYSNIYGIPSVTQWNKEVEILKTFAKARPGVILNDLTKYGFQSPVSISVTTFPAKAGKLTFNGLKIPVDVCSGGYPKGEKITLTAVAKDGYVFLGWEKDSDVLSGSGNFISTSKELVVSPKSTFNVTAVFEVSSNCVVPAEISTELTLSKACSPYIVPENVNITSSGKLIIEPGVEIYMSDGVSIFSSAAIQAEGTELEPVVFKSNPQSLEKKWGIIHIKNADDTVIFKYVVIENASEGPNPVRDIAALAIDNSTVLLDNLTIENVHKNPLNLYNCRTTLINSRLHSNYAGCDVINIKRGKISMYKCEFIGNDGLDSDALDFGEMLEGSSVRNCYFHDFEGFNSDAVDLGDHAKNVVIDSIIAFNINDKGVSIGQRSSTLITNSVFINCGMGAGMKDSSSVSIDHCTYYGNYYALANYQKHPGDAGSNLVVTNSILSNSYEMGYFNDEFSKIDISNSSDDTEKLPDGKNNLHVNPLFANTTFYDLSLQAGSPLIGVGTNGKNLGANLTLPALPASAMICDIAYVTELGAEDLEMIGIYNPGDSPISMDGCMFTSGIKFTFPKWVSISPKDKIYVTSNTSSSYWNGRGAAVYQWESGHLDDAGEKIQFVNKYGKVIDQVKYNNKSPWPLPQNSSEGITLARFDVDNHFGENWAIIPVYDMVGVKKITAQNSFNVYPNPTRGLVTISNPSNEPRNFEIFNFQGKLVKMARVDSGTAKFDLSNLENGIYFIRSGKNTGKIMLMK
jgi:hypothetical protein